MRHAQLNLPSALYRNVSRDMPGVYKRAGTKCHNPLCPDGGDNGPRSPHCHWVNQRFQPGEGIADVWHRRGSANISSSSFIQPFARGMLRT